ncbi:xanthine dehydrogenase molybdopterin binding subunit [Rhodobacteraceae bacterium]|nr:xanthine dehydrogenase molybdopterin binding subunit [Paracoccaceae bacterium]
MSVAKSLPHDAASLHVTGAARYVDDIPLPVGALHLAFGCSKVAHGLITSVDLEAVRQATDVITVLTAKDLSHENDVSPSPTSEPFLSDGTVHFVGQPIFLVVAKSHLAARRAARMGQVQVEPLPAVLTLDEALAVDSRFEDGPRIYEKGDAVGVLSKAARVVHGEIEIGGQEHFYLEGQAAAALPQEDGGMVVYSSSQHPSEIQHKVAHALGVPMHDVRVEVRRMGGGFGGKESQGNALAVACAIAAAKTGRPCKMRYDRDDDMEITGKRHDFRIGYRAAFEDDGRITAVDFLQLCRCGWSMDLSLPVADRAMLHADNAYAIANLRVESHRLKTNTQSNTAFRGFGGPQGMVGIERVLDHVAHEVELDPVEVRRVNYYAPPGGDLDVTHYGMAVEDFILAEMTDHLLENSDYIRRKEAVRAWNAKNAILKKGIAFSPVKFGISFTLTHLNQAGALVHVYQDGSIHLNHGGTEMGQGLFQKVAQVAASRFGVDIGRVKITATDTDKVPNTSATAASSGSDLNGMAVLVACDTIRARLAEFVAGDDAGNVRFEDGLVRFRDEARPFADVVKSAYMARISLSSTGFYATPKVEWDRIKGQGRPFFYFAYGAAVTEVVIDTLTGENRILRADVLHDCGASLNPALDIGQIEGGYVQGAGWLTTEELIWDEAGRLQTHAPSTYKIPACSDRPEIFNVTLWDGANREETVYRSKAVGEPPLMLGISALLALSDAAGAVGTTYPDLDAPATPERVLMAVERVRS